MINFIRRWRMFMQRREGSKGNWSFEGQFFRVFWVVFWVLLLLLLCFMRRQFIPWIVLELTICTRSTCSVYTEFAWKKNYTGTSLLLFYLQITHFYFCKFIRCFAYYFYNPLVNLNCKLYILSQIMHNMKILRFNRIYI